MKAVWRGVISFGLVTIGVRLYTATEEHDFRFHQVHREDGGRIRHRRVCQVCGEEIAYADVVKGYELDDGRMVVVDGEDLERLPVNTDHAIDVVEFVPVDEVDPIYFRKSYYLEPDRGASRPYVLLRMALARSGRLAVVKITIRQRETLALLRARGDLLVMHTMLWPDEVRRPDFEFLGSETEIRPRELRMASSLVESMTGSFDPGDFSDDYTVAMRELIEAKAGGAELPERPVVEEVGGGVDLVTALERSVERAKSARGGRPAAREPGEQEVAGPEPSARKAAVAEEEVAEEEAASPSSAGSSSGSSSRKASAEEGPKPA